MFLSTRYIIFGLNFIIFYVLLLNYCFVNESQAAVGGLPFGASVFPFLTSGWYYKPGPTEAVVLGLIVVKILALKLAATLAGVPHHLNDIKFGSLFDSGTSLLPRGKRSYSMRFSNDTESATELFLAEESVALERILLALRRIDSHDCFIRYICQVNQNTLQRNSTSNDSETWLNILRLRPRIESNSTNTFSIWDTYDEALTPHKMDCNKKYKQCPLTENDLTKSSLLSDMF